jgi:iron(III) transport system substrate-binding protein
MKILKFLCLGLGVMLLGMGIGYAQEVNLYSARKEALIKPLLDEFSNKTGIHVNLVTGKADALLKRLETEGSNTPADVLITVDAGRLHRAKVAELLQPINSEMLQESVPANYRDPENYWFGLSLRARPIMYAIEKLDPNTLTSYEDLAAPKWKGKICVRSSNNIYNQSLVASMIVAVGEQQTEQWARALVANLARPPKGGDRDQIRAAAAGQCVIAIANTYYLARMTTSKKDQREREAARKIGIIWPNQNGRGAHINVSGAGVTKFAKHKDNAIKLLEFLVSDEAQRFYADSNHEYPVKAGMEPSDVLKQWGSFKGDAVNLSLLGKYNSTAVKLMDRAGWR